MHNNITNRAFPEFQPPRWLRNPHAQTLAAVYLPGRRFPYRARQHQVRLEDGDRILLHDDCPSSWQPGDRTVLMLHGLAGCHRSAYMIRIAGKLNELGVRTFRMDMRGCGEGMTLARMPYHSGRSDDVAAALEYISQPCPASPITLIGFSMGGNISLKLLGELGDRACGGLDSAVVVCPAVELRACSARIEHPGNRVYQRHLLKCLLTTIRRRGQLVPGAATLPSRQPPRTLRELDERFIAPVCGFADADDYYQQCSSTRRLDQIRLPTVILAAEDDPLIPFEQYRHTELSPTTQLFATEHGGHLGYISRGGADADRRWMDWRVVEWVLDQAKANDARESGSIVSGSM